MNEETGGGDASAAGAALALLRAENCATARHLRARIDAVVAASRGDNADDEHDPEGSTIAFEREQARELLAHTERRLAAIDAALVRVKGGSYGMCASCGEPIAPGRLEALPFTSVCVCCAASAPNQRW